MKIILVLISKVIAIGDIFLNSLHMYIAARNVLNVYLYYCFPFFVFLDALRGKRHLPYECWVLVYKYFMFGWAGRIRT